MFNGVKLNYRRLFKNGKLATEIKETDLLLFGGKNPRVEGGYENKGISFNNLLNQILRKTRAEDQQIIDRVAVNETNITALQGQVSGLKATRVLTEGELDTLGTVGVEILPDSGAGRYYDVSKIRVTVKQSGQITYTTVAANRFWFTRETGSSDLGVLDGDILNDTVDRAGTVYAPAMWNDTVGGYIVGQKIAMAQNIYLQLLNGVDPTKANVGTIPTVTVEIWYDLVTV